MVQCMQSVFHRTQPPAGRKRNKCEPDRENGSVLRRKMFEMLFKAEPFSFNVDLKTWIRAA